MSRHILTRDGAVVYDYTDPASPPIETPNPPVTPPGTGTLPPGANVDFDLGEGGGGFFPHDDRIFPANTWVTIAFTVKPGQDVSKSNIDVSPGTGNWRSGSKMKDIFPDIMHAPEEYGLPIGNNYVGRGPEHGPGIPIECYAPGRYRYSFQTTADQSLHFQYRP